MLPSRATQPDLGQAARGGPALQSCVIPGLGRLGFWGIPPRPAVQVLGRVRCQQFLVPQVWLCHHAEVTQ